MGGEALFDLFRVQKFVSKNVSRMVLIPTVSDIKL
jgi:hypothetical protein